MRVWAPHSGHTSCTFDACTDASRSTMPPLTFLPGFGFVWRLIMLTPSTISRVSPGSPGSTLRTRPRLPRSLPVITRTLSFFRSGVAKRDILILCSGQWAAGGGQTAHCALPTALKHFRRQRNNLHEPPLAQLAGDGAEHARTDRLVVVVDQHGGVAIEPDVGAVAAALLLDRADDHGLDDLPLLHGPFRRRFLDRRRDDVAQPGITAGRPANGVDDGDLARAGVVGDVQNRSHLYHDKSSCPFVVRRSSCVVLAVVRRAAPDEPCTNQERTANGERRTANVTLTPRLPAARSA